MKKNKNNQEQRWIVPIHAFSDGIEQTNFTLLLFFLRKLELLPVMWANDYLSIIGVCVGVSMYFNNVIVNQILKVIF